MNPDLLPERIAQRIVVNETTGCWEWQGYRQTFGYGVTRRGPGRRQLVHRAVYELLVAPIPDGMQADHVCHNTSTDCPGGVTCEHRRCARPDHLAIVPIQVNAVSSPTGAAAERASRTHCPRGHAYSGDNVYLAPRRNGTYSRACRTCHRERMAAIRTAGRAVAS